MLTPLESNMSILNIDHMANNHAKDPNAASHQTAQQVDIKKEADQFSQSIQAAEQAEGEVKIGEKEREKRERDAKKKKRAKGADAEAGEPEAPESDRAPATSRGFSFIA